MRKKLKMHFNLVIASGIRGKLIAVVDFLVVVIVTVTVTVS